MVAIFLLGVSAGIAFCRLIQRDLLNQPWYICQNCKYRLGEEIRGKEESSPKKRGCSKG